ncbi:MAG: NYN domain-containing protein [bacterium]
MDNYYFEKLKKSIKGRAYIFIDAANLERSVQDMWVNPKDIPDDFRKHYADDLRWRVDYKNLKEFFESICDCKKIIFYSPNFKTPSHIKFLAFLKDNLNLYLKTKHLKEYKDHTIACPHRKANFDVEIAVDATFELNKYDTFILFSGDCDFEYLLKFLRSQHKRTIVFSMIGHIAKELPPAANDYFDIIEFRFKFFRIILPKAKNLAQIERDPAVHDS